MTRSPVFWTVFAFSLVFCRFAPGSQELPALSPTSPFRVEPQSDLYWNEKNCCGLIAAYHVLHEQGLPVGLEDLSSKLEFGKAGTSLASLVDLFRSRGLNAVAYTMPLDELVRTLRKNPGTSCIVHTAGDHWMAAAAGQDGRVLLFDYPRWYSVPLETFRDSYDDTVLLIDRENWLINLATTPSCLLMLAGAILAGLAWRCSHECPLPRETHRVPVSAAADLVQ